MLFSAVQHSVQSEPSFRRRVSATVLNGHIHCYGIVLNGRLSLTDEGHAAMAASIEAEAISEFGSLSAAAAVAHIKAKLTGDLFNSFLTTDLEIRV